MRVRSMSAERQIKAKEIIREIISGIGDYELMHKYGLTHKGLQNVYRQLLDGNLIEASFLEGRVASPLNTTETAITSRLPRRDVYIPLPVQDFNNPEERGIVTDISERGLGVKGLRAEVGEERILVVKASKFFQLKSFILKAKCRWMKPGDDVQEILAGFEIISITKQELQELKNLIEALDYMNR